MIYDALVDAHSGSYSRAATKQPFEEGTWFALPLRSRGFALGLVARTSTPGGIVLAYFFPKVWEVPPQLEEALGLRPSEAIRVLRVGDLSLVSGSWPALGKNPDWRRDDWGVPPFVRKDDLSRKAKIVRYSDDNISLVASEVPTGYDSPLERDAVLGAGAAEVVLTRLLT